MIQTLSRTLSTMQRLKATKFFVWLFVCLVFFDGIPLLFSMYYVSWKAYRTVNHFPEGHPDIVSSFNFLDKRSRLVIYSMKLVSKWPALQSFSSKYDFNTEDVIKRTHSHMRSNRTCFGPRTTTEGKALQKQIEICQSTLIRTWPCHVHKAGRSIQLLQSLQVHPTPMLTGLGLILP